MIRTPEYIWGEPYNETISPISFTAAEGEYLVDEHGRRYLDWSSSLNAPLGHSYRVNTNTLPVNVGNYSTPQRDELVRQLALRFPYMGGFQFRSSGTEAVEAALRYVTSGFGTRPAVAVLKDCYHGLTLGSQLAMGLAPQYGSTTTLSFIDNPQWALQSVRSLLTTGPVALLLECVQGASLREIPTEFLNDLLAIRAESRGQLRIICDDMLASIRCGAWSSWALKAPPDEWPDAIVGGKVWSNGFPFSFFGVSEQLRETAGEILGTSSFGGNPIACANALATLQRIQEEGILERIVQLQQAYEKDVRNRLSNVGSLRRIEWHGLLFGLELSSAQIARDVATKMADKGVLVTLLPSTAVIRCSPALATCDEVFKRGVDILINSVCSN